MLVTGDIFIIGDNGHGVAFKTCAQFTKCITKIDETTIDDAEDLDLVLPMYSLSEYSSNYSETTGGLWFYSKDEAIDFNADIANDENFKSIKYKAKLLENTAADGANRILKSSTIAVSFKYLNNFWRLLEMPLIICKVESKLKWRKYCVLFATSADNVNGSVNDNSNGNNIIFTIKGTKLYVPDVTLSARDYRKLSKLLSKEFQDQFIETNIKQERQMNFDVFLNQTLLVLIDCFF